MRFRKVNEREAQWIQLLSSIGSTPSEIADRYGFKRMDVYNVLRGNAFSWVTGIINRNIKPVELTVVRFLLKSDKPYREIANYTGIDDNKVRNIMGFMEYNGEISIKRGRR